MTSWEQSDGHVLAQAYRDRADAENMFDELKNPNLFRSPTVAATSPTPFPGALPFCQVARPMAMVLLRRRPTLIRLLPSPLVIRQIRIVLQTPFHIPIQQPFLALVKRNGVGSV
jgi:hypothetical protein